MRHLIHQNMETILITGCFAATLVMLVAMNVLS